MSDQPTPVGFEASFETKEFESGLKRFIESIDKLRGAVSSLEHTINQFAARAQVAFDSIGQSSQKMSRETDRNIMAMSQAMRDGGVMIGQATETTMEETGERAGKKAGESLLVGIATATLRGGGIEKVGSAIGSALGFAIGSAVAPGVGGTIGALIGGSAFGSTRGAVAGIAGIFGPIGTGLAYIAFLAADTVEFISDLFSGLGKLIEIALTPIKIVGKFIFNALATAAESAFGKIGEIAKSAFSGIVSELQGVIGQVARLQEIEAGLNALVRSALVIEDGLSDAREAVAAAVPIVGILKSALVELSLTSPFTIEQINSIFRVNTAFGIAIDTSMQLTEAMVQFGAATGFGADSLNLIARNLAQIAKFGQVYRRDIYQLANAGVDLSLIVREELNMSIEELNQALQDGSVNMNDLLNAFVTFAETNFAGSAEDLSRTIVGLQNRFETLKTLLAQDFLTPIINNIANSLDVLFQAFGKVLQTGVFQSLGEAVASVMRGIVGDVDWTVDTVAIKIMEFIQWFVDLSEQMFNWGYGMMEAWGYGMIEGAIMAINAVVDLISSVLTSLFSTHSPPAILPLIDQWGAETIGAWLEGMTQADFSILNQIIGPIETALSQLGFEQIDILSSLQDIVAALSGEIDIDLSVLIGDIAGPYAEQIIKLLEHHDEWIRASEELEEILKRVAEAEAVVAKETEILEEILSRLADAEDEVARETEVLDAIMKRVKDAEKEVARETKVLDEIMRRVADAQKEVARETKVLNEILKEQREAEKEVAREADVLEGIQRRQRAAQRELNAEMKELELITREVTAAQKELEDATKFYDETDAQIQRMVREYNKMLRAGADDDALSAQFGGIRAMQEQRKEASELINDAKEEVDITKEKKYQQQLVVNEHKDTVDAIKDEADAQRVILEYYQDIVKEVRRRADAQREVIDGYKEIVSQIREEADEQREIIDGYKQIVNAIKDEADKQREVIDRYKEKAALIKKEADEQREVIKGHEKTLKAIQDEADAQRDVVRGIEDMIKQQDEAIRLMLKLTNVTEDLDDEIGKMGGSFGKIGDGLTGISGGIGDITGMMGTLMSDLDFRLLVMKTKIDRQLYQLRLRVRSFIEEIRSFFKDEDGSLANLQGSLDNLATTFEEIGGLAGIAESIMTDWEIFKGKVKLVWQHLKLAWHWLDLMRIMLSDPLDLDSIIDAAKEIDLLEKEIDDTKNALEDLMSPVFDDFDNAMRALESPLNDTMTHIGDLGDSINLLGDDTEETEGRWKDSWDAIVSLLKKDHPTLALLLEKLGESLDGFGDDTEETEGRWKDSWGVIVSLLEKEHPVLAWLLKQLGESLDGFGDDTEETESRWGTSWTNIGNKLNINKDTVIGLLEDIGIKLGLFSDDTEDTESRWETSWNNIKTKLGLDGPIIETAIRNIKGLVSDLGDESNTTESIWRTTWNNIKSELQKNENPIKARLGNIGGALSGIAETISGMLGNLQTFLSSLANAVIPWWLQQHSPSPIEKALMGMREHLSGLAHSEMPEFTAKLNLMGNANAIMNYNPTPTSAYQPSAINNNSVNNTFNMGGNTVRDDMDLAILNSSFQRTLRKATYGA